MKIIKITTQTSNILTSVILELSAHLRKINIVDAVYVTNVYENSEVAININVVYNESEGEYAVKKFVMEDLKLLEKRYKNVVLKTPVKVYLCPKSSLRYNSSIINYDLIDAFVLYDKKHIIERAKKKILKSGEEEEDSIVFEPELKLVKHL